VVEAADGVDAIGAFVAKPFEPDTLASKLRKLLGDT
jgi:hypothetical protein